ncbi:hypothetical protein MFUL124B02_13315 [Myxococcus fulvus 124B02]|nr:hypothetical protein MFUL124B02_13315 [Myxococcus fulvus 124B02]
MQCTADISGHHLFAFGMQEPPSTMHPCSVSAAISITLHLVMVPRPMNVQWRMPSSVEG